MLALNNPSPGGLELCPDQPSPWALKLIPTLPWPRPSPWTPVTSGRYPGTGGVAAIVLLPPLRTLLGLGPLNMEVLSSRPRPELFPLQMLQLRHLRQTHQTSPTFSWHLGAECVPFPTPGPLSWGRILAGCPRGEGLMDWHTGCDCLNGVTHSLPSPYTFCIAYLCLKYIKVNLRELP